MSQEYPARVWEITSYIDNQGSPCEYDNLEARPLWSSHNPSDDDRLRRRKTEIAATKRREQTKAMVREAPPEPLRRKG